METSGDELKTEKVGHMAQGGGFVVRPHVLLYALVLLYGLVLHEALQLL